MTFNLPENPLVYLYEAGRYRRLYGSKARAALAALEREMGV